MTTTIRNTLIGAAIVLLAVALFFAGFWYSNMNGFGPFNMMGRGRFDTNNSSFPDQFRSPGGMMGFNSYGPGMMRGNGGMMNGNGYGQGMMNGFGNNPNLAPITIDQAQTAGENYLKNVNNPDLKIAEIMVFDNNAYILVREISTGNGAFELLADSSSTIAYPEHGPNMMWNLKYGGLNHQQMMNGGGMMSGNYWNGAVQLDVTAEMTVTSAQAIEYAQKYLDANIKGATAAADPITFYGYYTLDYEVNGKVAGMLSVNGYSGQVFLHTWHGTFVEESQIQ